MLRPYAPRLVALLVALAAGCGSDDAPATSASTSGADATGGDATSGGTGTTGSGEPAVPTDIPYCGGVVDWDPAWAALEEQIVEIVNMRRAEGANCGSAGTFGPAAPLVMQPNLRCAARVHSEDMADRGFFDHVNPDGDDPFDRMMKAGYAIMKTAGENIAAGNATAEATMEQWMNSDGHCANIMNPDYKEIGVGYYPGGQWGHLWTQTFGG